jgi:hypothetical protein
LAYRLYPAQAASEEQEITYGFELNCRPEDEAHMRALVLQAMSQSPLTLTSLRSEDIEGTNKLRVTARIRGLGRQDQALEQLVVRLYLEAGCEFGELGRPLRSVGIGRFSLRVDGSSRKNICTGTHKSMLSGANTQSLRLLIKAASAGGCCRRLG